MSEKIFLSIGDVMQISGVSRATVQRWIDRGQIHPEPTSPILKRRSVLIFEKTQFDNDLANIVKAIQELEVSRALPKELKPKVDPKPKKPIPPKQKVPGWVYLVSANNGYFKIGKSTNIKDRLKVFNVKLPFPVDLMHAVASNDYSTAEKHFHNLFASKRGNGEWFQLEQTEIDLFKSFDVLDF